MIWLVRVRKTCNGNVYTVKTHACNACKDKASVKSMHVMVRPVIVWYLRVRHVR
jgi:hypothetical protein